MKENSAGATPIAAPVFVAQGTNDDVVRPAVTALCAGGVCAQGTAVRYLAVPDENHFLVAFHAAEDAVAWMGDRFAGKAGSGRLRARDEVGPPPVTQGALSKGGLSARLHPRGRGSAARGGSSMRRWVLFLAVSAVVAGTAFAEQPGSKKRRPLPPEFGRVIINNASEKAGMAAVSFDHWYHRAKYTCRVCHVDVGFAMKPGATGIKAADNQAGFYCGACHNGKLVVDGRTVFESCGKALIGENRQACLRCHSVGKNVTPSIDFKAFTKNLPSSPGTAVDRQKAQEAGADPAPARDRSSREDPRGVTARTRTRRRGKLREIMRPSPGIRGCGTSCGGLPAHPRRPHERPSRETSSALGGPACRPSPGRSRSAQSHRPAPPWKKSRSCAKTQDAMALPLKELESLVARCDKLKPAIEKLDESQRKVYARRLKVCRDLYQFVIESRVQE